MRKCHQINRFAHAEYFVAFNVIIPARYGATRLPGKPLIKINGRPLIQHVYERARASAAEIIVVATDDARVAEVATAFGAQVCMTASHHPSGSDRIAEVLDRLHWPEEACVVNLQGDEPCMPPTLINQVAMALQEHADAAMTTLATPIRDRAQVFDPNSVKVVTDAAGYALYFSRAPIPWHRDRFLRDGDALPKTAAWLRHIGLYAYRAGFLRRYVTWPPAPLEQIESLEQLRVLWRGERIYVGRAMDEPGPGVDTPDDLARVERLLTSGRCVPQTG
jgi:3-deoxy-manno-octulosonate cytidylyltransferase (CMP-KDO synthetase)